jgi:hypothetical protein
MDVEGLRRQLESTRENNRDTCPLKIEMWVDVYLSNGLNGMEAYQQVYKKPIDGKGVYAYRNTPDVRTMIAFKAKELSLNSLVTKLDLLDEINEVKAYCKDKPTALNMANLLKAIEMQTKMLGYNEPEKVDLRIAQVIEIDFGFAYTSQDDIVDIKTDEDNPHV